MDRTLFTIFIVLVTMVPVTILSLAVYHLSPYRHISNFKLLPTSERVWLYTAAAYPMLSLIAIILISNAIDLRLSESLITTAPYNIYFGGHTLLSAWGAAMGYHLFKQHKAYALLIFLSLFAGSIYLIMITWAHVVS